jgi:hypothetical protein
MVYIDFGGQGKARPQMLHTDTCSLSIESHPPALSVRGGLATREGVNKVKINE